MDLKHLKHPVKQDKKKCFSQGMAHFASLKVVIIEGAITVAYVEK